MKTTLIIVRHGNTFSKGEIPTRIGCRTDLPLIETQRAESIANYLLENNLIPDTIFSSPLKRCVETANIIKNSVGYSGKIQLQHNFTEIDYGIDENKTEEAVELRLGNNDREKGKLIIENWNKNAIVPNGWIVDVPKIIDNWKAFANNILQNECGKVSLLVSSNGIIRFAPYLTENFEEFSSKNDLKVATGGICIFEKNNDNSPYWECKGWNGKKAL